MANEFRIITYGRLADEFKTGLSKYADSNDLTIDHKETFNQNKFNEYNALASFSLPDDLDISHIKWIHSFGAGVDQFINRSDLNKELILTRTVGSLGKKIAEYCLVHVLACKQNIYEAYNSQKMKEWKQRTPVGLMKSKIAILGTGSMGAATAKLFSNLGAEVIGVNRDGRAVENFSKCYSFEQFTEQSILIDTLISTLPSATGTKEILTTDFFSKFSVIHFINVGRGNVVTEETILTAIEQGNVSRATLDVFSVEPLPSSSKLWNNENIFITPHQASLTDINDVLDSFHSVYEAMQEGNRNSLFVDLEIGY